MDVANGMGFTQDQCKVCSGVREAYAPSAILIQFKASFVEVTTAVLFRGNAWTRLSTYMHALPHLVVAVMQLHGCSPI